MRRKFINILRLLRPRQWIKNFAVFAAITFSGHLFDSPTFGKVVISFIVFCLLSSAIYVINDLFDVQKDRLHPFKRFRPLANGDLSKNEAIVITILLALSSFVLGYSVNLPFFILIIAYALLQISYSALLKHITAIDILAIAAGYILRVYGGEFASGYHISVWLLLTTIMISLFLAVGKRRSELTLLKGHRESMQKNILTRQSLSHYSERLLDVYASIFATATFITYALFTFQGEATKPMLSVLLPQFLPDTLQRKWLMITIIPVVYGLMRYLQDIYEKHEGESPEKVLLSDTPLLITVAVWIFLVITIIYVIGP